MLGGNEHLFHLGGLVVDIADAHLGLSVGAQVRQGAVLAYFGEAFCQAVRQEDGHGHERGSFVAGVAEHHALVAGTHLGVLVFRLAMLLFPAGVDAAGDVGGLLGDGIEHAAGVAVEAVLGAVVADAAHDLAGDLGDVHPGFGADFAGNHDHAGADHGLGRAAHVFQVCGHAIGGDVALTCQARFLFQDRV